MIRTSSKIIRALALCILIISAGSLLAIPSKTAIKRKVMEIEVTAFNKIIDGFSGGLLFNIFGGKSKAKRGFLNTQRAIMREDFSYFPKELEGKKGKGSVRMLHAINRS